MDKDKVRDAADGNWRMIFLAIGIGDLFLSDKHGPCPKCGGEDRFRFYNDWQETGGCICNQCNSEGSADGFSTIEWFLGVTFNEAIVRVGRELGLKPKAKKDRTPEEQLERIDWLPHLESMFLASNKGITSEGLKKAGAFMAGYQDTTVIAFPVYGIDLVSVAGYVVMNSVAKYLTKFDKEGKKSQVRHKMIAGSKSGFIGQVPPSLEGKTVVKCEGATDMLAVLSCARDDVCVISNASGTHEHPKWMADHLAKAKEVWMLHDADKPGQEGALRWCKFVAVSDGACIVKNIELPYPIEEKKGADSRDLVLDKGPDEFWEWLVRSAADAKHSDPSEIEVPKEDSQSQQVLDALEIDVVGENEKGEILIYSKFLTKTSMLKTISRVSKQQMLQIAGIPAMAIGDDLPMKQVINAIAIGASSRRIDKNNRPQGIGMYRSRDDRVVLSNGMHLSYHNGTFERLDTPRCDDLIFDFGTRSSWYDHDVLAANMKLAEDQQWCYQSVAELVSLIDRWTWRNQQMDPTILAGLVIATFCQSLWKWRPAIAIRGASNCGKSVFAKFLFGDVHGAGVFGQLAHYLAQSTAAGLRQSVSQDSVAICLDEWDSTPAGTRREILSLIRTSGGGERQYIGSSNHQAISFGLRHIPWILGIHVALDANADLNRFLCFDMETPPPHRSDAWVEPSQEERDRLFDRLLAISVVHGLRASQEASVLHRRHSNQGIENRLVSNLSVPVAMLATSSGIDPDDLFAKCRKIIDDESKDLVKEEDQLLDSILSLTVRAPKGEGDYTLEFVLIGEDGIRGVMSRELEEQAFQQLGCRLVETDGQEYLAVQGTKVGERLKIEPRAVAQILGRLPGSVRSYRIRSGGGHRQRFTLVPTSLMENGKKIDEKPF